MAVLSDALAKEIDQHRVKYGRFPATIGIYQDHYFGLCAEEGRLLKQFCGAVLIVKWGQVLNHKHRTEFERY